MFFDSPGLRIVDLPTRKVALKGGVSQRSEVLSVPESARDDAPWRCLFCRMRTGVRLFRMPVCTICRDQVQDFVWVSLVLVALVPTGFISGAALKSGAGGAREHDSVDARRVPGCLAAERRARRAKSPLQL